MDGLEFEGLSTMTEFGQWLRRRLPPTLEPDDNGRVFINTYNEVIGAVRLEVVRHRPDQLPLEGRWLREDVSAHPAVHTGERRLRARVGRKPDGVFS